MKIRRAVILTTVLALVLAVGVGTSGSAPRPKRAAAPEASGCFRTFQSGSGNTFFKWCFSNHGNINLLQTPKGPAATQFTHLDNNYEGYAVCSNNGGVVHGYDASGTSESGFGPGVFNSPNRITRTTTNGRFRLVQVFTQNPSEGEITVTMTLTNIGPGSIGGVQVSRYADFDIDNGSSDFGAYTNASAFQWNDQSASQGNHGEALTGTTFAINKTAVIEAYDDFNGTTTTPGTHTGCGFAPQPSPTGPSDLVSRVTYNLGSFAHNQAKTFKFRYARL